MKTIGHISDLHFGAEDPVIAEGLVEDLKIQKPDLLAVSGDLTQRARRSQFEAAHLYLERFPYPRIIVPGNHDVPLYDVMRRFLQPFDRFRKYIEPDLMPSYQDEDILVIGVNTARSASFSGGRISLQQVEEARSRFCRVDAEVFKIMVTHHPFLPPETMLGTKLVGRASYALERLESCHLDLLLAGHLHLGYSGDVRKHHLKIKRSIIVAQSGTTISHRRRSEPNSYNVIRLQYPKVSFEMRIWNGRQFERSSVSTYEKVHEHWEKTTVVR